MERFSILIYQICFSLPCLRVPFTRYCAVTGRMLRHGNGPGRQAWSGPKLSILPGT